MNNLQTAERIKELCKIRNISVKKLLEECEMDKGLIYVLEKRGTTPLADKLEKIADYFDCSVDYLMGRTENPEINK